jgi:hypothetical protein
MHRDLTGDEISTLARGGPVRTGTVPQCARIAGWRKPSRGSINCNSAGPTPTRTLGADLCYCLDSRLKRKFGVPKSGKLLGPIGLAVHDGEGKAYCDHTRSEREYSRICKVSSSRCLFANRAFAPSGSCACK